MCGCAYGWSQNGGGDTRGGGDYAEWETVGSVTVSSGSPNWDFGARGAGIWKITAQPVNNAATGFVGATDSSHLKWNSGGVTMDNYRGRDKSYKQQYDSSSYASLPLRIDKIQADGHYSYGKADKVETWGCGHDSTGLYRPYGDSTQNPWTPTLNGAAGYAANRETPAYSHARTPEITNAAIFVWMTDVTMHALPSGMPLSSPTSSTHSSGMPYGLESLGRNFLTHTAGGTIAGSISDVDSSIASEQWTVRLHKLSPVPDHIWLRNEYTKPIAKVRVTRWTGNVSYDANATNWVFPLWSYDAVLNRSAPAQMGDTCSYHLFESELNMPLTWQPEVFYAIHPRKDPLMHESHMQETIYLSYLGRDQAVQFNWNQESSPLTFRTVRAEDPISTTGVVRNGRWQAWSFRPIFDDGTEGEEMVQHRGGYRFRWKGGQRRVRGTGKYATRNTGTPYEYPYPYQHFYSWETPANHSDLELVPLKTSQHDYYFFGAGHKLPTYQGRSDLRQTGICACRTMRAHDSTLGGMPKCLHLGVPFEPTSRYNITPSAAVSF